jgi:hypothetical protein
MSLYIYYITEDDASKHDIKNITPLLHLSSSPSLSLSPSAGGRSSFLLRIVDVISIKKLSNSTEQRKRKRRKRKKRWYMRVE